MKTHLSLLIFFASFVTRSSHGACDDTPTIQELIGIMINTQAHQYLKKISAPATCELNKKEFYDFLQQRITQSENGNDNERTFLSYQGIGRLELSQLLKTDPNIRVPYYYRLQVSDVHQRLVAIRLGCYPDYWNRDNRDKEAYLEYLKEISGDEYRKAAHNKYSDDDLNQLHLEASHALAQEALRLFFQETKNPEEHE